MSEYSYEKEVKMIYEIKNLGCANCAMKMEAKIKDLDGVDDAVVNFSTSKLHLKSKRDKDKELLKEVDGIISSIEADASLVYEDDAEEAVEEVDKKFNLIKLLVSIVLLAGSFFVRSFDVKIGLLILAYVIAGGDIVLKALKNISKGQVFDENFLMSIASIGAMMIGEFSEGVAVMVFFSLGEYLQDMAVENSRKSITSLMDIKAEYANVKRGDTFEKIDPEDIKVGDIILVKPGEKFPVDARLVKGSSAVDTSALTGESLPVEVDEGDKVLSGGLNLTKTLELEVLAPYEDSQVAKILTLVEESGAKKAPTEKYITRFSRVYTPVVCISALVLAVVPPILGFGSFSTWLYRAMVFLVASCPCALVVSIPLGFFAGIGRMSKEGIIAKGAAHVEDLAQLKRIGFDKTGTLTEGTFKVQEIRPAEGISEDEVLKAAAMAESMSNHPIALSILKEYKGRAPKVDSVEEIPGHGLHASYERSDIYAGNKKLMDKFGFSCDKAIAPGTVVYVGVDKTYLGYILIKDQVKEEAREVIDELKNLGLETIMLTGDNEEVAKEVARTLSIDDFKANLLPQDKVDLMEEIVRGESDKEKTAFVGDGINDAPVLVLSDVGVAMGQIGSDAAIEAADVVVMEDDLRTLPKMVDSSRSTMKIVRQNIIFSLGVKALVLILGALGLASMWMAVFADTGVALLAILNSIRLLYTSK